MSGILLQPALIERNGKWNGKCEEVKIEILYLRCNNCNIITIAGNGSKTHSTERKCSSSCSSSRVYCVLLHYIAIGWFALLYLKVFCIVNYILCLFYSKYWQDLRTQPPSSITQNFKEFRFEAIYCVHCAATTGKAQANEDFQRRSLQGTNCYAPQFS